MLAGPGVLYYAIIVAGSEVARDSGGRSRG